MKDAIRTWLADKGLPLERILTKRPHDLTPDQVRFGIEAVYQQIMERRAKISDRQLAFEFYRTGKLFPGIWKKNGQPLDSAERQRYKATIEQIGVLADMLEKEWEDRVWIRAQTACATFCACLVVFGIYLMAVGG